MAADVPPTPCLLGATATGKTDVAVALARATRGEVISCDAFAAYAGMPILTAAPEPPPDVPHHLVGFLDPAGRWSAADFAERTDTLVADIRARGGTPWVVGGTALYLRGWLKGFGAPVGRDEAFREALRAQARSKGSGALHARLAAQDPARAQALHPNDERRLIRALEIIHLTGRPASDQRPDWDAPDRVPARLWCLRREPEDLEARVQARTRALFDQGVVEEAQALRQRELSPEASKVLGLKTLGRLLSGEIDRDEAIATIALRTRQFARKQGTFFRSFADVTWIDVAPHEPPTSVARRILTLAEPIPMLDAP